MNPTLPNVFSLTEIGERLNRINPAVDRHSVGEFAKALSIGLTFGTTSTGRRNRGLTHADVERICKSLSMNVPPELRAKRLATQSA